MIRVTGVAQTLRGMKATTEKDVINIAEGLKKAAGVVLRKSQKYVPVSTGLLKKTGRIVSNGKKGLAAESRVEYGSEQAHYALWVHENLEAFHSPPTCARFLAKAVRETRGTITSIMKRQIKSVTVKTIDTEIV